MRLLLDTRALLWWLGDDTRLGSRARALIEDASNEVFVSVASLWELDADIGEVMTALEQAGFALLGIDASHLVAIAALPSHHRDPFDHLLIAQAVTEGGALLTDDQRIRRYPVRCIACSDARPPADRTG